MRADPRADVKAAGDVASGLARAGYTERAIIDVLGDESYSATLEDVPVQARRLDATPLSVVVRLLFLALPVERREAERALGARALEALAATGLAALEDDVVPLARVLPIGDLLLAADTYSRGNADPPDYVAAYTPTSRLLDNLTPRRRVRRALDVGTGSGVQALRAAAHARSVVATDVNERALAYARLNAALNGIANVDFRHGSLFEPAAGETFDLVTCNAPFVVSPESRWAYRDTPEPADEFSRRVVRGAADLLADGGHAALLVSWVAADPDSPDERVLEWVAETGCDAWVLVAWEHDPLDHATSWNDHLEDDPAAFEAALDEWLEYFERLGVGWISEGGVLLHRRRGARGAARVDVIDEEDVEDASAQAVRAFDARARLAGFAPDELLELRLAPAMPLVAERPIGRARRRGRICLDSGTNTCVDARAEALDVLALLDGRASLKTLTARVSRRNRLDEAAATRLRRDVAELARDLLELGALHIED